MASGSGNGARYSDDNEFFNPHKKAAMIRKYDLNAVQRLQITPDHAHAQIKKNLENPLIGPDMKRVKARERELIEFAAEEQHAEHEMRKAGVQTMLYNKAARLQETDALTDSQEHQAYRQFLEQNTREALEDNHRRKKSVHTEITKIIAETRARVTTLLAVIKETAKRHRISTVEKTNEGFFISQQRTTGVIMPKYLSQEITGHNFFKLFDKASALAELDKAKVMPIVKKLLESTPVEHHNDRLVLHNAYEKLTTDKLMSRLTFTHLIQSVFTEELHKEYVEAMQVICQSPELREQLDLPIDGVQRERRLMRDNLAPCQLEEKEIIQYRKYGKPLPEELKQAAQRLDSRNKQKEAAKGGQNKSRKRGQGGQGNQQGQNKQGQQGQKSNGGQGGGNPGQNGNANKNNDKQGNAQHKKKKFEQAREKPPPKTEAKPQ